MSILEEISAALQRRKKKEVTKLVQQAIGEGLSADAILKEGLLAGMDVIGGKFKRNEVFVPEVLMAARSMNAGTALLKPLLAKEGNRSIGKACIGTVQGDMHDIGKNLVKMMLEGKGIEVVDLGVDVPAEKFVECAQSENCQLVCCSALLTTTMPQLGEVVKAFENAGIRNRVKIMVGGAPVTKSYSESIHADQYTDDAASAAEEAVKLLTA